MAKQNVLDIKAKISYIGRMLHHRWQGQARICPYCGPPGDVTLFRRKKWIVEVLQCQKCRLWFRWPVDTPTEHNDYYENEFAEDAPQVVLPEENELRPLLNSNFAGSPLDVNDKIRVLQALRPGARVLDFGSSWGYGTYQLRQQGFDTIGFEISSRRAAYGRERLGLTIMDEFEDLERLPDGSFDIVFSNHVVEHLPNIQPVFLLLSRLLKENGFVFHVLPNFLGKTGRDGYWINWIGQDHPIAPAMPFFNFAIPRAGLSEPVFGSDPFTESMAEALRNSESPKLSTEGDQLLVYARKLSN